MLALTDLPPRRGQRFSANYSRLKNLPSGKGPPAGAERNSPLQQVCSSSKATGGAHVPTIFVGMYAPPSARGQEAHGVVN